MNKSLNFYSKLNKITKHNETLSIMESNKCLQQNTCFVGYNVLRHTQCNEISIFLKEGMCAVELNIKTLEVSFVRPLNGRNNSRDVWLLTGSAKLCKIVKENKLMNILY